MECNRWFAADIKKLTQLAKEADLVTKMWGKHAHISEVVDKDSTPSEIKRLTIAQTHTNYKCSMILEDIVGITNLDATAPIFDEESRRHLGNLSLCQFLLQFLQLSDGHQLIAEVHQSNEIMGPVQAVIPNTPKAERMILMLNKNVPSYIIGNVLKDQGLPELFLLDLVKKSCCPTQLSEMANCTWDSDTGTLTTHQEATEEKNCVVLETALWFKDAFADLGSRVDGKPKKSAPPPETLFNLKDDQSVKLSTIVMNRQPLPRVAHPHGRGKARLSKWQALMRNLPSHLVRMGHAPQPPLGMRILPPLVMRVTVKLRARPMADSRHTSYPPLSTGRAQQTASSSLSESRRRTSNKGNTARGQHNCKQVSLFRQSNQNLCVIDLIGKHGNHSCEVQEGRTNVISHQSVLQVLEHCAS